MSRFVNHKMMKNFMASFLISGWVLTPVWADDIEIFYGNFDDGEISPNVMFIVDTSGSMGNEVSGTGLTRIDNVKVALREILNNLNDVNVGMMRFSNPGGPVLYPVSYIDKNVLENEAELVDVIVSMSDGDDDAQEIISSGAVDISDQTLRMVTETIGTSLQYESERIDDDDDDGEEDDTGCTNCDTWTDSSDLDFHKDTDNIKVALRFNDLGMADNATINNAYVTFTTKSSGDGLKVESRIQAEIPEQDKGICDGNDECTNGIKNRMASNLSTEYIDWDISSNPAVEEQISTPDLTDLIQEIVDDDSWPDSEDDVMLWFTRRPGSSYDGRRHFYSWDGTSYFSRWKRPTLHLEYYNGLPPTEEQAITGLRFQDVDIPRGVTITSASITFQTAQADADQATSLTVYGQDSSTPAIFTATTKDISNRSKTSQSVPWQLIRSWDTQGETHNTPELKTIVQHLVNRSDWCAGNNMAFILEGLAGGLRMAYSRNAGGSYAPVLNIQYDQRTLEPGESCRNATISKQIVSASDDAWETGTTVSLSGQHLEMDTGYTVGLRFTNIKLPEDADVSSAYIEFEANDSDTDSTTKIVYMQAVGDADSFSAVDDDLEGRAKTSGISWTVEDWYSGNNYQTPNLETLLETTTARDDWIAGNDMVFLITHASGDDRDAESYDDSPLDSARLVINFIDDGTFTDERTVREELLEVVDSLNTSGWTPIQDALYEAALYYTGGDVKYGLQRGGSEGESGPHSYTRVSVEESMVSDTYRVNRPGGCSGDNLSDSSCAAETISGANGDDPQYKTPIDDWCQRSNHIILLTDGSANRPHSDTEIKAFKGTDSCETRSNTGENCVKELVSYINNSDQSDLIEKQTITTHTIGFNFSSTWLEEVATAGGGQYKEATQAQDLVDEIEGILNAVLEVPSSFVAPVVAINQFNRLNHRNEIYFAVFIPTEAPSWPGNLKKYRLAGGSGGDNSILDFSGANDGAGKAAVNSDTGYFKTDAESDWWTDITVAGETISQDGAEVQLGGAEANMPLYSSRNMYTYYEGSSTNVLSHDVNRLVTSNVNLTQDMFNVSGLDTADFNNLINWTRGQDIDDEDEDGSTAENRYIMGDPLHSKPVAVTYGGTEAEPDITVFYGTNTGFLHAVDADDGAEVFSFIPESMLPKQKIFRQASLSHSHEYGLDSSVTPWIVDRGTPGTISGTDSVKLYFGMRRGGHNYYGMDVTDRANPKLDWVIKGGTTGAMGDYSELGYSWSQAVPGKIKVGDVEKQVLYISGGYDPNQDDTENREVDSMGRALYIVDRTNGHLIWSGGPGASGFTEQYTDMQYSIPSSLSVASFDSSGYDSFIYVGDMGGQVWRFDIHNGLAIGELVTGGVIADLGVSTGANTPARNRRFYHGPDIAVFRNGDSSDLAVTIGSGWRAHPLAIGAEDYFFMLKQGSATTPRTTYSKIALDQLYNATTNDVGLKVEGAQAALNAAKGWYIALPNMGEKVLSTPLTFKNTVTWTTYEPSSSSISNNCIPSVGTSRLYQVNLNNATPKNPHWDGEEGLDKDDRSYTLRASSIVVEPVIVCTGAGCDLFVGIEKPPVDEGNSGRVVKTFWRRGS